MTDLKYWSIISPKQRRGRLEFTVRHLCETQKILDAVNSVKGVHSHLGDDPINFNEPIGVIPWHRRTGMNFPLDVAAYMCEVDIGDTVQTELGWKMPKDSYDYAMRNEWRVSVMSEMSRTDYAIYAEDGSMFCMCHCDGDKIELEGKGGKRISLIDLQRLALNPELAQKCNGKRRRFRNRTDKD